MLSHPYFVELVHCLFNDFRVICQDARLEVASRFSLHANSRTREICTTHIYLLANKDKHLEMNTQTKHSLQAVVENRVLVKVLPEVWSRFFCMNEPYLHTTTDEHGNESKEWLLLLSYLYI